MKNNSITAEDMSKEQTPIEEKKYPILYGWELKENENGVEMAILPAEKIRKLVEWCEKEDERIKAKVKEEKERIKQWLIDEDYEGLAERL